jgi:hypothetical protein
MRSSTIKWIVGSVAFFLPTIATIVATSFFYQNRPEAFWGSLVVAAIVPPALVLSSSVKRRFAFAFGLWALLLLQFCLILLFLLAGFRE